MRVAAGARHGEGGSGVELGGRCLELGHHQSRDEKGPDEVDGDGLLVTLDAAVLGAYETGVGDEDVAAQRTL